MKNYFLALVAIMLFGSISGCIKSSDVTKNVETPFISESGANPLESPLGSCVQLCKDKKDAGADFSTGPCLSNEIVKNWVCDISHEPRTADDNKPENQCPAFINGTAKHFVELNLNCDLVRMR